MWRILESKFRKWKIGRYRRRTERALGLHRRGEARCDGLKLNRFQNRLEIEWQARDVHPWDRDLPAEIRAPLLVEQVLADTEAAISRLFDTLPAVDVIELRVLHPASESVIIEGTVFRSTLNDNGRALSLKMRLLKLGVNFRLVGARFESLAQQYDTDALSLAASRNG